MSQFLDYCQAGQEAALSMERMQEVEDEPDDSGISAERLPILQTPGHEISIKDLVFRYPGAG